MNHKSIESLLAEHEIITNAVELVNSMDGTWQADADTYAAKVRSLITFFREYADGYHHLKEEDILFPALNNCVDFTLGEMLTELEMHHQNFRDYTAEMEEQLTIGNYPACHKVLQEYCNDLLDHIGAENDELFVLAENLLNEQELETIYFRFNDMDAELGQSRKQELETMISDLLQRKASPS